MNRNPHLTFALLALLGASGSSHAQTNAPITTEATLYSTLPSTNAHRPEMAMDGDPDSFFRSAYGMSAGDDFTVLFSQPLPLRSLRITTGDLDGDNLLTQGFVEVSPDGTRYTRAASFDAQGVASTALDGRVVAALRIKVNADTGIPALLVREIALDSPTRIGYIGWGAGRAFSDYSAAPDLKAWADKADQQMNRSWPDTAARLYSDGFITPNKVNVFYRSGPNVTPVAAMGGGEMEVNIAWARAHPDDTGLTVHEVAHVVQATSAYNPVWLVEGIADYIRWAKFEPENFKVQINPDTATYRDSYRTTGAFLAWCELHTDARLVSKLNQDVRFGTYSDAKFKQYTGKDVDALWSEFLADYQTDPIGILTPPLALADRPRVLPVVAPNSSIAVNLAPTFNNTGIASDGATFETNGGFDDGGAAFSGALAGRELVARNVRFVSGAPDQSNVVAANGESVALPAGKFGSLWLLGAAINGVTRGQSLVVTYDDGTTQSLAQNFSDWFAPQSFPGESRALKMNYRNLADGTRDARPFALYAYGFALDPTKTVRSLSLPRNRNIRIVAISLAP